MISNEDPEVGLESMKGRERIDIDGSASVSTSLRDIRTDNPHCSRRSPRIYERHGQVQRLLPRKQLEQEKSVEHFSVTT